MKYKNPLFYYHLFASPLFLIILLGIAGISLIFASQTEQKQQNLTFDHTKHILYLDGKKGSIIDTATKEGWSISGISGQLKGDIVNNLVPVINEGKVNLELRMTGQTLVVNRTSDTTPSGSDEVIVNRTLDKGIYQLSHAYVDEQMNVIYYYHRKDRLGQ